MPDSDEGGQELEPGQEPGAGEEGLDTQPAGSEGTPPEEGAGQPAEEPWRAPIGEAIAGLTAEVRQALTEHGQRSDARFDEMSRRFQQPTATPPRPETPKHKFDDPMELLGAGADPELVKYFQTREERVMGMLKEIRERQDTFEQTSTRRRQGDEMATHFDNEMAKAIKSQEGMADDAEAVLPIVTPMIMGQALTARDGNPRSVDVGSSVKGLETYVQARIEREIKKRTEAGLLQAGKPVPPQPGQGTRPTVQRREVKTMGDMDAEWDAFQERWPEGPPE